MCRGCGVCHKHTKVVRQNGVNSCWAQWSLTYHTSDLRHYCICRPHINITAHVTEHTKHHVSLSTGLLWNDLPRGLKKYTRTNGDTQHLSACDRRSSCSSPDSPCHSDNTAFVFSLAKCWALILQTHTQNFPTHTALNRWGRTHAVDRRTSRDLKPSGWSDMLISHQLLIGTLLHKWCSTSTPYKEKSQMWSHWYLN